MSDMPGPVLGARKTETHVSTLKKFIVWLVKLVFLLFFLFLAVGLSDPSVRTKLSESTSVWWPVLFRHRQTNFSSSPPFISALHDIC